MLYEIVYGFGPISHNFELYTSHPRRVVAVDADEDCLGDQFPLLLYAEINKDSPDLIDFLSPTDSAMVGYNKLCLKGYQDCNINFCRLPMLATHQRCK